MTTIDLVLPFALPPPELARDLLHQLKMPALATLLARGSLSWRRADPYSRLLPHHDWLMQHADPELARSGLAATAMAALGLAPAAGKWFVLHPASLHIARDHLVLTDLRQVRLDEMEARALFEAAQPLFEDAGRELLYGSAGLWFMRADDWDALETSSPDSAAGHNIDIWMSRGTGERAWRKLHNEVQMTWHSLALNHLREMSGRRPVNALWCWDAGPASAPAAPTYDHAISLLDAFLPVSPPSAMASLPELIAKGGRSLAVVDTMTSSALAGDWGDWIGAMQQAEQQWFAPLLQALAAGKVDKAGLVLTDSDRLAHGECGRMALKKFWVKPSLAGLAESPPG